MRKAALAALVGIAVLGGWAGCSDEESSGTPGGTTTGSATAGGGTGGSLGGSGGAGGSLGGSGGAGGATGGAGGAAGGLTCTGDSGAHQWSVGVFRTAPTNIYPHGLALDGSGDVLVGGQDSGLADFGCGAVATDGANDSYVVKLDGTAGSCLWSRALIGTNAGTNTVQHVFDVAVDSQGDVYAVGGFAGELDLDGDRSTAERVAAGSDDAFVVKYDGSTGAVLWAESYGATGLYTQAYRVAVDEDDDVLVTGLFEGAVSMGGFDLTATGDWDSFALKLDGSTHAVEWAVESGGADGEWGEQIVVDGFGDVVVGGGESSSSFFVTKLDGADGHVLWSHDYGDGSGEMLWGLGTLQDGDVVVGGRFETVINLGTTTLTIGSGTVAMFVARLDGASGDEVWAKQYGGVVSGAASGLGDLTTDRCDTIVLVGDFDVSLDFGLGELTTSADGDRDVFVAKLDEQGSPLWASDYGGAASVDDDQMGISAAVAPGATRAVAAAGYFRGTINFGGSELTTSGTSDYDTWIALFAP